MKRSDGLFLRIGREVAARYPGIECTALIADNTAMQLVRAPERFQVLLAGNLFGDLLSELATGIVGGPLATRVLGHGEGMQIFHCTLDAYFEEGHSLQDPPLHFVAPAYELLRATGAEAEAERLRAAVVSVLQRPEICTPDAGGHGTTRSMVSALRKALESV